MLPAVFRAKTKIIEIPYQIGKCDECFFCRQNVSFVHEDEGSKGRQGHHEGHRGPDEGHDGHQPSRFLQNDDLVVANAQHLQEQDQILIAIVIM